MSGSKFMKDEEWEYGRHHILRCLLVRVKWDTPPPSISDGGEQMRVSYALLKHLQLTAVN